MITSSARLSYRFGLAAGPVLQDVRQRIDPGGARSRHHRPGRDRLIEGRNGKGVVPAARPVVVGSATLRSKLCNRASMELALGVLGGIGVAAIAAVAWRALRAPRAARAPQAVGMQSALHAAASTLPHLRRGLSARTAEEAVPHLRALTGAAAIALADTRAVLAIDGQGREQQPGGESGRHIPILARPSQIPRARRPGLSRTARTLST